jgi:hypothetical protein
MDIKVTTRMDDIDLLCSAYTAYADAFAEVNTLAVNRHLMTRAEFDKVALDERVSKYLAYDGGELVGMSCITNDLAAWDFLIQPLYFARFYPELYKRRAIWYIGYVFGVSGSHAFVPLIGAMFPQVLESDGMFVQDFCTVNVIKGLPQATAHVVSRLMGRRVDVDRIDEQAFYAGQLHRADVVA